MPVRMKRIPVLVGAALTLGAGVWWWRRAPMVDAQLAVASVGPLRATVDEMGTTRVRSHTDVNAPVSGRWVPVARREGDVLRAGDLLGVLYPAPMDAAARTQADARLGSATAALREAEARIEGARTSREEARRALARADALAAAGGVAPQEVERARDALALRELEVEAFEERRRAARFEREQAASALAAARGDGAGLRIAAPQAGTVLTLSEPHERVVLAGQRLLEVGDPRDLDVIVPLLTADALRVREGAEAHLSFGERATSAEGARTADTVVGRVARVEPSAFTRLSALGVEEQRVNVVVTVPAGAVHLGDRFRADARITVWQASRVVRVPASALVRDGDAWSVWRVRAGVAAPQPVRVGEQGGDLVEVRDGLAAGDTVVNFPGEQLAAGVRIRGR